MMKEWLDENGPFLDLLHEAAQKPTYAIPRVSVAGQKALYNSVDMDHERMQRTFARMLLNRAQYRVAVGEIDGAVRDIVTCKRLGRFLQRRGLITTYLIGLAVEGVADAIEVAATPENQPTAEQLKQFVDQLNAIPPHPGLERTMLAERYFALDLAQATAWGDEQVAEAIGERRELRDRLRCFA